MEQKKYHSIVRHGKTGTHETVKEGDYVIVWEKLDGANASFTLNEDGIEILCFSRNNQLGEHDGLRGFYQWVQENVDVNKLNPNYIYYGEWLVQHKINYGENANKFYLFDIFDKEKNEYLNVDAMIGNGEFVSFVKDDQRVLFAPVLADGYIGKDFTLEEIFAMAGQSKLAVDGKGEGVVIKNYNHKHRDGKQVFTKVVTKEFQENNGAKVKVAKTAPDVLGEFIAQTVTENRVEKILMKLVDEGKLKPDYAIEDMGAILKALGSSVAEDVLKEEYDELEKIIKKRIGRAVPNVVKNILTKC